jgi:hypothetical protein
VGRDLRGIQELRQYKNIRTTVRHIRVGCEQTRQTAEALNRALEWKSCGWDDSEVSAQQLELLGDRAPLEVHEPDKRILLATE